MSVQNNVLLLHSEMEGGRLRFPFFHSKIGMIDKKSVENIVNECLNGGGVFLVGVKVTKSNVITVILDGDEGVAVEKCIEVSRYVTGKMDRDKEDYELTVTSFGLGEYFTLERQYKKNVGENVEVVLKDGGKTVGILQSIGSGEIVLSGKKETADSIHIPIDNVLKTRVLINF